MPTNTSYLPFEISTQALQVAGPYTANLTRLQPEIPLGRSVFMLHGLMGNAKSFYNHQTQAGLATYLAQAGYDVFLAELRGRDLTGAELKHLDFGLKEALDVDLPALIEEFTRQNKQQPSFWLGQGLGSLLLTSYLAEHANSAQTPLGLIHFNPQTLSQAEGFKRKLWFNLVEQKGVNQLAKLLGYVPAIKLKLGTADEHLGFYQEAKNWLAKFWQNTSTNNYLQRLQQQDLPPSLYFAQQSKFNLNNANTARNFMFNLGEHNARLIKLGKKLGNQKNYKNQWLCLDPQAETDYYPLLLNWLGEISLTSY